MTWNRSKLKNSDHVPLYDRLYISALGPEGDSGDELRVCIAGFRIRGVGELDVTLQGCLASPAEQSAMRSTDERWSNRNPKTSPIRRRQL